MKKMAQKKRGGPKGKPETVAIRFRTMAERQALRALHASTLMQHSSSVRIGPRRRTP